MRSTVVVACDTLHLTIGYDGTHSYNLGQRATKEAPKIIEWATSSKAYRGKLALKSAKKLYEKIAANKSITSSLCRRYFFVISESFYLYHN